MSKSESQYLPELLNGKSKTVGQDLTQGVVG